MLSTKQGYYFVFEVKLPFICVITSRYLLSNICPSDLQENVRGVNLINCQAVMSICFRSFQNTAVRINFTSFHFISTYSPDSQETNGSTMHTANNYPDLLPEIPRCWCPVEFFV